MLFGPPHLGGPLLLLFRLPVMQLTYFCTPPFCTPIPPRIIRTLYTLLVLT